MQMFMVARMFVRVRLQFDKEVMRDVGISPSIHHGTYLVMLTIMVMCVIVFVIVMVLMSVDVATLKKEKS